VVVWVVGDATIDGSETGTSFRQALYFRELGFNLHDTMIYWRDCPPMNDNRYQHEFEYMFILSKGKVKTFNPIRLPKEYLDTRKRKKYHRYSDGTHRINNRQDTIDKMKGNIWRIMGGGGISTLDKAAFQHPAIFPEALARDHIISWSNPSDIVLDPMAGSGTTAKMAKENGRHWLGFDISQEYVDLARRRVDGARVPLFVENEPVVIVKPEQAVMSL
jgi:DNA modification methylase